MERTITAAELATHLAEIMHRIRYQSDRFIIEQDGEAIAALSPAGSHRATTMESLAHALRDLPFPDAAFADELEAIQQGQPLAEDSRWDL